MVKNPAVKNKSAEIFYRDIGDYLTRKEKLEKISEIHSVLSEKFNPQILIPNEKNDWINQRGNIFERFIALAPEKKFDSKSKSFFVINSRGMETARDAFIYNFSKKVLREKISMLTEFDEKFLEIAMYRPFQKQNIYLDKNLIHRFGQFAEFFPNGDEKNFLICVSGVGSKKNFSVFITKKICDLHFIGDVQCFPLYYYERE